ncbi:MAG: hypothetical protein JWQ73_702 [Variovorax sp.]|nr:hypothetical protein [Variovorax sp.]
MGLALLTFSDLFADLWTPLQSLADRWLPNRGLAASPRRNASGLRYVAVRPSCGPRAATPSCASAASPSRPLRVVRVVDPQEPGRRTSRMVISGRMADVCAELDRLAALEMADTPCGHRQLH